MENDVITLSFIIKLYKKYCHDLQRVHSYQKAFNKRYDRDFTRYANNLFLYRWGVRWLFSIITAYAFREDQRIRHSKQGSSLRRIFVDKLMAIIVKIKDLYFSQSQINPMLCDIEAEITYLLIREHRPAVVVEVSPYRGWSTTWILNALKDNNYGELYSYDLIDDSQRFVPEELASGRWHLIVGDVRGNVDKLPKRIDYLFVDSDHSAEFAHWYIKNMFPLLCKQTRDVIVSIHDVYHSDSLSAGVFAEKEGKIIVDYLKKSFCEYFTASQMKERHVYDSIKYLRKELKIGKEIIYYQESNSMIFFRMNKLRETLNFFNKSHV